MKILKEMSVTELFKQFCKERHAEDKGRNYDTLQEIYAKTELFDLSFVPYNDSPMIYFSKKLNFASIEKDFFKNISLPFESQFAKMNETGEDKVEREEDGVLVGDFYVNYCVFMREYAPNIITGTLYCCDRSVLLNMPFTIKTEEGKLTIDLTGFEDYIGWEGKEAHFNEELSNHFHLIIKAIKCLTNLPKHSVATDTPRKAEYYTRKHGSTIKVIKPIYYVLDKKEEKNPVSFKRIKPLGNCCFDHSFRVIGHWRRINPKSYGKNRNGEYVVTGMTWVKEHTRGEGDLIKKIRVVK